MWLTFHEYSAAIALNQGLETDLDIGYSGAENVHVQGERPPYYGLLALSRVDDTQPVIIKARARGHSPKTYEVDISSIERAEEVGFVCWRPVTAKSLYVPTPPGVAEKQYPLRCDEKSRVYLLNQLAKAESCLRSGGHIDRRTQMEIITISRRLLKR